MGNRSTRPGCLLVGAILVMAAQARPAATQEVLSGRLHVVWDSEPTLDSPDGALYFLVNENGEATEMLLMPTVRASYPDLTSLDRQSVLVEAAPVGPEPQPSPGAGPLARRAETLRIANESGAPSSVLAADVQLEPFITVMCRFSLGSGETIHRAFRVRRAERSGQPHRPTKRPRSVPSL